MQKEVTMSKNEEALLNAINRAYKKMLERKARLGEEVYTADENGNMKSQRAIDVYERKYGELKPLY